MSILFVKDDVRSPTEKVEVVRTGQDTTPMGNERMIIDILEGDQERTVRQGPQMLQGCVRLELVRRSPLYPPVTGNVADGRVDWTIILLLVAHT